MLALFHICQQAQSLTVYIQKLNFNVKEEYIIRKLLRNDKIWLKNYLLCHFILYKQRLQNKNYKCKIRVLIF